MLLLLLFFGLSFAVFFTVVIRICSIFITLFRTAEVGGDRRDAVVVANVVVDVVVCCFFSRICNSFILIFRTAEVGGDRRDDPKRAALLL